MGNYWRYYSSFPDTFSGPSPFAPNYIGKNPVCPAREVSDYDIIMSNERNLKGSLVCCGGSDNPSAHSSITGTTCPPLLADWMNDNVPYSGFYNGYLNIGGETNL
ncbi:MAG: hypothetical protein ACLFQV_05185 [Vulcanimicrobiota bacterium]